MIIESLTQRIQRWKLQAASQIWLQNGYWLWVISLTSGHSFNSRCTGIIHKQKR